MKKTKDIIYDILINKRYIFLLIGLALVTIFSIGAHKYSYNSDDVAQQTVIEKWINNGTSNETYFTPDPWTLKWPGYYLRQLAIPENSRKTVLIESWMQNVGLLVCLFFAYRYFTNLWLKKKMVKSHTGLVIAWVPFVWFFTLGESLASAFLKMPNTRNFEIGLLLLLFAIMHWIIFELSKNKERNKYIAVVAVCWTIVSSVLFFSDPYCLIFLGFMLAIYVGCEVVFTKVNPKKFIIPVICLGTAVVMSVLIQLLASSVFGIYLAEAPGGINEASNLGLSIDLTARSLLFVNGIALHDIRLLNAALAVATLFGVSYSLYKKKLPSNLQLTFLATIIGVIAAAILSGNMIDLSSGRYLVLIVPVGALLTSSILIAHYRTRCSRIYDKMYYFIAVCLALAIFVNVYGMVVSAYQTLEHMTNVKSQNLEVPLPGTGISGQDVEYTEQSGSYNALDYRLIDVLKSKGLKKGYSNYWKAQILTYLSNEDVKVSAIVCEGSDRKIEPYRWISTSKELEQSNIDRTFIIYDDAYLNYATSCNRRPLGQPIERFNITSRIVVEVYEGDIANTFVK